MAQSCRAEFYQTHRPRARKNATAHVVDGVVLLFALVHFTSWELAGCAEEKSVQDVRETDDVSAPDSFASDSRREDAAVRAAIASSTENTWGLATQTDYNNGHETGDGSEAGRAETPCYSSGIEAASNLNRSTALANLGENVHKSTPPFDTVAPIDGVTFDATTVSRSPQYMTTQDTEVTKASLESVRLLDFLAGDLLGKNKEHLLASVLQNTHTGPASHGGPPSVEELTPRQHSTAQLLPVDKRSELPSRTVPEKVDTTLVPFEILTRTQRTNDDGQSKTVGQAAARSTAADHYSTGPGMSPLPLTGLPSSATPVSLEPLSPLVNSFTPPSAQMFSSTSLSASSESPVHHAALSAATTDTGIDHSPLHPAEDLFVSRRDDLTKAGEALPFTAPQPHIAVNAGLSAGLPHFPQDTFTPAITLAGGAPSGPGPTGATYGHLADQGVTPTYFTSHIKRVVFPASYVPGGIPSPPVVAGSFSPVIVGTTVTNAVGAAIGHTAQLVDDTLRSAIVNVVNPAAYGTTSLLHGIQALNQKLQAGSDVATKAFLDFAAFRRNYPHHSLAEFINTLEEVTDTLNQAATTAPDPRLRSKSTTQTGPMDSVHVVGGELLEGMGHNTTSSFPEAAESSALLQKHSAGPWNSHQNKSPTSPDGEPPQQMSPDSPVTEASLASIEPLSSPHSPENTTQRINLRDVLTTEQLQVMEMLTNVLNVGFDAALGFLKRQANGIVGLTQFPFFKPLQHRVIQAAYRASDQAAADRAALEGRYSSGAESIVLDRNFRRARATDRVLAGDGVQNEGGTLPLTYQPASVTSTSAAYGGSVQEKPQFALRTPGAPVILPTLTAAPSQVKPLWRLHPEKYLQATTRPVPKHHQRGHMWAPYAPPNSVSSVEQEGAIHQDFALDRGLRPAAVHNVRSLPTSPTVSLARLLSPTELPAMHVYTEEKPVHRPSSQTHNASLISKRDGVQWHQQHRRQQHPRHLQHKQQQQHRQTTEHTTAGVPSWHSGSAPARRLHRNTQTIDPFGKPFSRRVPATFTFASGGLPSSPAVATIASVGKQDNCVLPNVRYKGLASVVDRRKSLDSCYTACRADADAAVGPQSTERASSMMENLSKNRTTAAVKPHAVPCSFISYFPEVGLCYQYAKVDGLIAAAGYTSAPMTCSLPTAGGSEQATAQRLSSSEAPLSQAYSLLPPPNSIETISPQGPLTTREGPHPHSSLSAPSSSAQQHPWDTVQQHGVLVEHLPLYNNAVEDGEPASRLHPYMPANRGILTPVQSQYPTSSLGQANPSASENLYSSATSAVSSTDINSQAAFFRGLQPQDPSPKKVESTAAEAEKAELHTGLVSQQNPGVFPVPGFSPLTFSMNVQKGIEAEVLQNRVADMTKAQPFLLSSETPGPQLTGQQVASAPVNAIPPAGTAFYHEVPAGLARATPTPVAFSVMSSVPLGLSSTGASDLAQALPPVAMSTAAVGGAVPLLASTPPISALSALPPLPSITSPIAGTASSILQTAQGLMQTGNALMQAFPLQQLLDAGQQLYASGFFRNRGMKHLQLPFLGQQKQELPPPPGMDKPTVACATEGMTCCVPENAAEKWKERPPYLNNREWDRKCRAHFVSMTNSLCATTSYILKGRGRDPQGAEHQTTPDTPPLSATEDEVDRCGLILTETRDFWVFRHTLVIPGRSMNNAICECKEPKTPNQEGLRPIEGFATWEFSLQAVHDMEAQVERGEKIAKGLGTALALTSILGRHAEETLGHMLEHTNPGET